MLPAPWQLLARLCPGWLQPLRPCADPTVLRSKWEQPLLSHPSLHRAAKEQAAASLPPPCLLHRALGRSVMGRARVRQGCSKAEGS